MSRAAIAIVLALALGGCVASGSYNSDGLQTSGYPCSFQVKGKSLKIKELDLECTGADPAAGGAPPISLPAASLPAAPAP